MNPIATLNALPHVRRAWPHGDALIFEQIDNQGHVRAGRITDHVEYAPFAVDKKLPTLTADGQLLVHRYGKRAVIDHGDAVTKHVRPGKAAAIARASAQFHGVCTPLGISAAKVTAQTDSSVTFAKLPGRTLHDDPSAKGWNAFFTLWPQLVQQSIQLPTFSADHEATTLAQWVRVTNQFRAHVDIDQISRAAQQVMHRLEDTADAHVLLHRDLHDKQLLWDGRSLSVLDVDTAARGEAALDFGNLLAHLYLRRMQGVLTEFEARELVDKLLAMSANLGVTDSRLRTYFHSALLRLCCVYAFRPTAARWLSEFTDLALKETYYS